MAVLGLLSCAELTLRHRLPLLWIAVFALVSCDGGPDPVVGEPLYLPEEDERVVSIERLGDVVTVVFDRPAEEIGLFVGQIVAGRSEGGYLLRVVTVDLDDNTAVIDTDHATLSEAVGSGSLHDTFPLDGEWQWVDAGDARAAGDALDLDDLVVFDGYTDVAELQVRIVEGSFDLDPTLVMDVEIADGELESFGFAVEGQLALDMTPVVSLESGFAFTTERVIASYVRPLSAAVGPCPLEGEVTIDLYAGIEISSVYGATVQGTVQLDGTFSTGARYEDGQWAAVWDTTTVKGSDRDPEVDAEGVMALRVWMRPQVTAKFFGRDGPSVGVEPYMEHEVSGMAPVTWSLTAGLGGAISVDADVFSPQMDTFAPDVAGDEEQVAASDGTWVGYTALDVGSVAGCALDADGTIDCWGSGTVTSPPAGEFVQVSVGHAHACALDADHGVTCWGDGPAVTGAPAAATFSSITSGEDFSCGIHDGDGTVQCWGQNAMGQLDVPDGEFTALDAGRHHVCAIDDIGLSVCWGLNAAGQTESAEGQFAQIASGSHYSCGMRPLGVVDCWGCVEGPSSTCEPPIDRYLDLSAGAEHACVVRDDGMVICWGNSPSGGTLPPPTAFFLQVSAGFDFSCGLTSSGNIDCWGNDDFGQSTPP